MAGPPYTHTGRASEHTIQNGIYVNRYRRGGGTGACGLGEALKVNSSLMFLELVSSFDALLLCP